MPPLPSKNIPTFTSAFYANLSDFVWFVCIYRHPPQWTSDPSLLGSPMTFVVSASCTPRTPDSLFPRPWVWAWNLPSFLSVVKCYPACCTSCPISRRSLPSQQAFLPVLIVEAFPSLRISLLSYTSLFSNGSLKADHLGTSSRIFHNSFRPPPSLLLPALVFEHQLTTLSQCLATGFFCLTTVICRFRLITRTAPS